MSQVDDKFYKRADAHIDLSNDQISDEIGVGEVNASMMYATARFNAWVGACGCHSGDEMKAVKAETVEYIVAEYTKMLEENFDDYIEHFNRYMGVE